MMGGVLYRKMMEDVIPGFYKEAPLERHIVEQRFMLMDKESAVTFSYKGLEWAQEPYNNFTVLCGRSSINGSRKRPSIRARRSSMRPWRSNASWRTGASSACGPTGRTGICMPTWWCLPTASIRCSPNHSDSTRSSGRMR
ncbi:hypothetical protein LJK88_18015 [Paenibacillus sp. P26]|nr:hypothetical protein LJK88_18015 [Paenibacillus sp. P26]